jgi:hypothetical protein
MKKGVTKSRQITTKMSGHMIRYTKQSWTRRLSDKDKNGRDWNIGKTPGSGLDDYVLDLMKLK